jgi:chemotaxis protein methyltransferase CheR
VAERLGLDVPERRHEDLVRALAGGIGVAALRAQPTDGPAWRRLIGALTVGESYFFRDHAAFAALERHVLPELIARRRAAGDRRLRLWSAGCAAGQEPYSLAILLDRLLPDRAGWQVTILGTDLDHDALETARAGVYREWALRDTPAWVRERGLRGLEVEPAIRELVTFAPLNLAADDYPGAVDVLLCRNVLMYLTGDAQRAVVGRLQRALAPDGWLLLAPAEASRELLRPLTPVRYGDAILYRRVAEPPASGGGPPRRRRAPAAAEARRDSAEGGDARRGAAAGTAGDARRGAATGAGGRARRKPTDREALLRRARELADGGELDDAAELCAAALRADRLDARAHLLRAEIERERGDEEAAVAALRSAIFLAPDSPAAHFLLGGILVRRGALAQGRRSLEAAVALLEPLDPHAPAPGADGITAGALLDAARAHLEPAA